MNKQKRIHRRPPTSKVTPKASDGVVTGRDFPSEEVKWWREAVEGLVIAIVLALLIRGFEAEAFVIPTGSMAATLMGRHKDVVCEQCEHVYAVGASLDAELTQGPVVLTTCPVCSYPQELNYDKARDVSFTGDRILVNKFAYDLIGEPERFDVIVFKNPQNAKQNYIKRLCGLPGETLEIFRGDIYVKKDGESEFTIARKPAKKILALLQLVHDTEHVPVILDQNGMTPRWSADSDSTWSTEDKQRSFHLDAGESEDWIRYRHFQPGVDDWVILKRDGQLDLSDRHCGLISDFYAYNAYMHAKELNELVDQRRFRHPNSYASRSVGKNWVGDLAVECIAEVNSQSGTLLFDLVEGGWHFRCEIDVASGTAALLINDGADAFSSGETRLEASTKVASTGSYRVMFSNVDDELRLWVNGKPIEFGQPSTYQRPDRDSMRPTFQGPLNPGDLAPVGIGGSGLDVNVKQLRVYRDVYYVAVRGSQSPSQGDYQGNIRSEDIQRVFHSPEEWSATPLFDRMNRVQFVLEDHEDDSQDQFFPMGDNSPQSQDARIWSNTTNYVERQFLIGEAVVIYWPHPWHAKISGGGSRGGLKTVPVLPNVKRMGVIH